MAAHRLTRCLVCGTPETVYRGYLCQLCEWDQPSYSPARQTHLVHDVALKIWWKWDAYRSIWRPYSVEQGSWVYIPKATHPMPGG